MPKQFTVKITIRDPKKFIKEYQDKQFQTDWFSYLTSEDSEQSQAEFLGTCLLESGFMNIEVEEVNPEQ